ncbi:hypothetical protein EDC96DRAFT_531244 [Choanephora cucurbitarum]|nr:hypothetical protein EDC96DRAFT_531244 [Choanephora cucurbitarum]
MKLDDNLKDFKAPHSSNKNREFFHTNGAAEWDFFNYYIQTHEDLNKLKKFNVVAMDYKDDLDWIINSDVPKEVIEYASFLKSRNIPSKATIKANIAKLSCSKKERPIHNSIVITGNNHTITNSSLSVNETCGKSEKKRCLETQEEEEHSNYKKGKGNDKSSSVWKDWLEFLRNKEIAENFHPFSPENHGIIRCGKGVSAKPNLDENIYARHLKIREEEKPYPLPAAIIPYVNKVMNSESLKEYKRNIENIPEFEVKDEIAMKFVQGIFNASYNLYKTKQNIKEFESIFNDLYIYPYLKITANALFETREKSQSEFTVGEIPLKAMSTQLDSAGLYRDDAGQYKADGIITLYGIHRLEILLLETSSHFGCTDRSKISFDHHKGLFGALSMLKTIADTFYFASIEQFGQMKAFFTHAAEKTIYLWSLRYEHEGRVYELWLERKLHLQPEFEKRDEELLNIINFYWSMKSLLEETTDTMLKLQEEHKKKLVEYRFSKPPSETLETTINPSILKLTEESDKAGMHLLGPFFTNGN